MGIDFSPGRWDNVVRNATAWWEGKLDRPLAGAQLIGRDPGRAQPDAYLLSQDTCLDFSISADEVIDRIDYELSRRVYLGDAFPHISLHAFGAGVLAAFLGARMDNSISGVWFHPPADVPLSDMSFAFDPDQPVFRRIADICRAAAKRWQGQVQVGMTDLGGIFDVLASFRTTEKLLMDLYDCSDEVVRCAAEIERAWRCYYDALQEILSPVNPGYTDWIALYSPIRCYTTQCDFSYMISPEMFGRFILPELQRTWGWLGHGIYHLDGVGELPHLPQLLASDGLHVVQWVPGDGKPNEAHWPEVYKAIHDGGKRIIVMNLYSAPAVIEQTGGARVACSTDFTAPMEKGGEVTDILRSIGVPV